MSLYTDYNPSTTIHGMGYKNKHKAIKSIKILKNQPKNRQIWTIISLYYRAKYHPYRTDDMEDAMYIYAKWLDKHIGTCPPKISKSRLSHKKNRTKRTHRSYNKQHVKHRPTKNANHKRYTQSKRKQRKKYTKQ